jgi:hypothetical protein
VAGADDGEDAGRRGGGEEGGQRRRPTATAAVRGRKTSERKEAGRLWAGPIKVCGISSAPPRVEDRRTREGVHNPNDPTPVQKIKLILRL